jgi:hypothetical protein
MMLAVRLRWWQQDAVKVVSATLWLPSKILKQPQKWQLEIGSWYSITPLMGLLLQAVQYFRRALKLNRHYLSAWTLMGHEYVEMKNPPAAIGASYLP